MKRSPTQRAAIAEARKVGRRIDAKTVVMLSPGCKWEDVSDAFKRSIMQKRCKTAANEKQKIK